MSASFGAFLETIGRIPVLTRTEEVALSKRIQAGGPDGDVAKEKLIEHNIRLAVSIAKNYARTNDVPLEDLVQEGILGVNRAAEKFDWQRGFKFSTYATWWIKHFIQRAIHRDRTTIRVPGHIAVRRRNLERYLREHPDANLADAAAELKITLATAEETMAGGARVVASLDEAFQDDGTGNSRYSTIPDDAAPDPADLVGLNYPKLTEALSRLDPLEKRVIELRFGFHGPVMSRDQVAETLRIRPHVVQRKQKDALKKLNGEMIDLGYLVDGDEE